MNRTIRHEMRMVVLAVLVKARERWPHLTKRDRIALVKHMRAIAGHLEECTETGGVP